jgi:hypothetical protein
MGDQLSDDQGEKMLQFMAAEHSVLQAERSATIFETGGRTAVFLGTVSRASMNKGKKKGRKVGRPRPY